MALTSVPGTPGDFRFAHELVRETLYDELSINDRMRLHRTVAERDCCGRDELQPLDIARRLRELLVRLHVNHERLARHAEPAEHLGRPLRLAIL